MISNIRTVADSLANSDALFSIVKKAGKDEVLGETGHLGESVADKHLRELADRWEVEFGLVAGHLRSLAGALEGYIHHITRVDDFFDLGRCE